MNGIGVWPIVFSAGLGILVGMVELAARYRDDPWKSLATPAAILYMALNGLASLGALFLINTFSWTFGMDASDPARVHVVQVLVAGLGAMALFRSSLFIVKLGDTEMGMGPSGILQVLLNTADRAVDRKRAENRATLVATIMEGVSFDKAKVCLGAHCLGSYGLMQNVSAEEQNEFARQLKELVASDMSDRAKALSLGLALMNIVGEDVLRASVMTLREDIRSEVAASVVVPGTPA